MALVVLMEPVDCVVTVVPPLLNAMLAVHFHSPGPKLTLVTLAGVLLVSETGVLLFVPQPVGEPPFVTCAQAKSPTAPALALLFVVVATIPAVCEGAMLPDTVRLPASVRVRICAEYASFTTPSEPLTTLIVLLGVVAPLPTMRTLAPLAPVSVTVSVDVLPDVVAPKVVKAPLLPLTGVLLIDPPEIVAPLIVGLVRVLLLRVSVVVRPTRVSVDVGSVRVPVLTMLEMDGAVNVGDVPNTSGPVPVSSDTTPRNCVDVVLANCDKSPVVTARLDPQIHPEFVAHSSALFVPLQLGKANAEGAEVPPVALPSTEFAATGASDVELTLPQFGVAPGPPEIMACPAADPAGLNS